MMIRTVNRIILLLLCLMNWQAPVVAAVETPLQKHEATSASVDRTDDLPKWQDVKMHDVLAVTGGSTLTPPTTVRVVHDSPAGTVPTAQTAQSRHYSIQRLLACSHRRTVSGYIYKIRCLRL